MSAKLPELWLKYADDDLASAEILLKEGIYNIVCFHSQQAVEKMLKSIIAAYGQEIPRIHNLIRLTSICEKLHGDSLALDDEALIFLNDVYIDSRYPADFGILPSGQPGRVEAHKAFLYAKQIGERLRPLVNEILRSRYNQP